MMSLRRRLLVFLADEGTVEHPAGKVTTVLAGELGTTTTRVSEVLRRAHQQGHIQWKHSTLTGRTFRVRLTHAGRCEVGRDGRVGQILPRPRPVPVSVMPVPGPMVTVPFDPDLARERALGGVA